MSYPLFSPTSASTYRAPSPRSSWSIVEPARENGEAALAAAQSDALWLSSADDGSAALLARLSPPPSFSSASSTASSSSASSPLPEYQLEVEGLQQEAERLCSSRLRDLSLQRGRSSDAGSDRAEEREVKPRKRKRGKSSTATARARKKQRDTARNSSSSGSVRDPPLNVGSSDGVADSSGGSEREEGSVAALSDSGSLSSSPSSESLSTAASGGRPPRFAVQRRSKLPLKSVYHLRAFFTQHVHHVRPIRLHPRGSARVCAGISQAFSGCCCAPQPYPSEEEKRTLAGETGLSVLQVTTWFTNTRRRFLRPFLAKLQRAEGAQQTIPTAQQNA